MPKVLILIEAESHQNCPHPEVGPGKLPRDWEVLPVDSSLWLPPLEKQRVQLLLRQARQIIDAHTPPFGS